jgi:hypothetical protein
MLSRFTGRHAAGDEESDISVRKLRGQIAENGFVSTGQRRGG